MASVFLTLAAIVSASFHIWAEYEGPPAQVYICKPLTMGLIIAVAMLRARAARDSYALAIVAGLLCSLAGDIFLMLPSDRFVPGLVSFLIGHLFYIAAFTGGRPFRVTIWALTAFASYGLLIFLVLLPRLGGLTVPVAAYIVVILAMGWQAWERRRHLGTSGATLAVAGAVLFILSDSILALNRFHTPFHAGRFLNLSTYFIGQWCLAMSVGKREKNHGK